jgi:hypothetical protein
LAVTHVDTEDLDAEQFTEPASFIDEDWEVAERNGPKALRGASSLRTSTNAKSRYRLCSSS